MSSGVATRGVVPCSRGALARAADRVRAISRGLRLSGLAMIGLVPLTGVAMVTMYVMRGVGDLIGYPGGPDPTRLGTVPLIVVIASVPASRSLARLTRRLAGRWCGVAIAEPYQPMPPNTGPSLVRLLGRRAWWLARDPATWRDLLWLPVAVGTAVPFGAVTVGLGLFAEPELLRGYGLLARSVLCPTRGSQLERRVTHLAQTRTDTLDAGALELRRIERDLHDGAQARLVAMGMTLEAAGQLVDTNPVAAKALLAEARQSSVQALAELRDLVRGIHPPVLADRGLAAALSALALDSQVRVQLDGELPGRPSAPVESAAYFAVSELLANVVKHAEASRAWLDIRHEGGMLRIGVIDDGIGGADPARGTGLRGIERRLAAFDGVLALSSPPGGPTVVNMEIPCELSSPKTYSC